MIWIQRVKKNKRIKLKKNYEDRTKNENKKYGC